MFTFENVMSEMGISGTPWMVPALGQFVTVKSRMITFLMMGVRSVTGSAFSVEGSFGAVRSG